MPFQTYVTFILLLNIMVIQYNESEWYSFCYIWSLALVSKILILLFVNQTSLVVLYIFKIK